MKWEASKKVGIKKTLIGIRQRIRINKKKEGRKEMEKRKKREGRKEREGRIRKEGRKQRRKKREIVWRIYRPLHSPLVWFRTLCWFAARRSILVIHRSMCRETRAFWIDACQWHCFGRVFGVRYASPGHFTTMWGGMFWTTASPATPAATHPSDLLDTCHRNIRPKPASPMQIRHSSSDSTFGSVLSSGYQAVCG